MSDKEYKKLNKASDEFNILKKETLIKTLNDAGLYKSAMNLKNWDELDEEGAEFLNNLSKAANTRINVNGETIDTATVKVSPKEQSKRTGERTANVSPSTAVKQYTSTSYGTAQQQASRQSRIDAIKNKKQPVKIYSDEEKKALAAKIGLNKSDLIDMLFKAGQRESALNLHNWGEKDNIANNLENIILADIEKSDDDKYDVARLKQQNNTADELHPAVHNALSSWYDKKGGAKGVLSPEQYEKFKSIKEAKQRRSKMKIVKDK
jgi:hypothetical protein